MSKSSYFSKIDSSIGDDEIIIEGILYKAKYLKDRMRFGNVFDRSNCNIDTAASDETPEFLNAIVGGENSTVCHLADIFINPGISLRAVYVLSNPKKGPNEKC